MSTMYHVRKLTKYLDFSDGVTIKPAGDLTLVPDSFLNIVTIVDNTLTGAKYYFPYKRTLLDQEITGEIYNHASTTTTMDWDYCFNNVIDEVPTPSLRLNGGNLISTLWVDNWLAGDWDFDAANEFADWEGHFIADLCNFFEANKANYTDYGQDGGHVNLIFLRVIVTMSVGDPRDYFMPFFYLGNDPLADYTIELPVS